MGKLRFLEVKAEITTKLVAKLKFEPRSPVLAPRPVFHLRELVITKQFRGDRRCLE